MGRGVEKEISGELPGAGGSVRKRCM